MIKTLVVIVLAGGIAFPAAVVARADARPSQEVSVTSPVEIQRLGLRARVHPKERDADIQQLAHSIATLSQTDRKQLQDVQKEFQEALLLVCDPGVYDTLSMDTLHAVDDALEQAFTMDDINRDTTWEPLIYVYGYFNRDASAKEIARVRDRWEAIPEEDRGPYYPTYPHVIDAVTKPLTMGPLFNPEETGRALDVAVPMLRDMLLQPPLPGRAYHPPSHAALVLGPLYDRWAEDPALSVHVRSRLGDREAFTALLAGQLVGSLPDRSILEPYAYDFYAYTGRYIANALARFNGREALPALQESLAVYLAQGSKDASIAYTRRALVALGDETERASLEKTLASDDNAAAVATLVWLCRNGRDETVTYASRLLGKHLNVPPDRALQTWFEHQLTALPQE